MQPINARILVQVQSTEYKHLPSLGSDKQHEQVSSVGKVVSVAADADETIKQLYYKGKDIVGVVMPSKLVGKTVRWVKYAEQNALFDMTDPSDPAKKVKAALIEYKDITAYEN